jgi:hypothetical protein
MFQAEAGRGDTTSARSTRNDISDTVATYAISNEQGEEKTLWTTRKELQ